MHAELARHGGSNDEDMVFRTSIAGPARGGVPLELPFLEIAAGRSVRGVFVFTRQRQ